MIASSSSRVCSRKLLPNSTPALLTRMSSGPIASSAAAGELLDRRGVGEVGGHRLDRDPARLELGDQVVDGGRRAGR